MRAAAFSRRRDDCDVGVPTSRSPRRERDADNAEPDQCRQDLSAFHDRGGKAVFWHGTADPLIFFRGSVDYYDRLVRAMGGAGQTDRFARFFVAPGVGHCGGGQGAAPTDVRDAVVRWVEQGRAPSQLAGQRTDSAGNVVLTRPVCQYGEVARYKGHGALTEAKNFRCTNSFQ